MSLVSIISTEAVTYLKSGTYLWTCVLVIVSIAVLQKNILTDVFGFVFFKKPHTKREVMIWLSLSELQIIIILLGLIHKL